MLVVVVVLGLAARKAIEDENDDDDENDYGRLGMAGKPEPYSPRPDDWLPPCPTM